MLRTIICDIEYGAVFIAKRRHVLQHFPPAVPFVSRQFNDNISKSVHVTMVLLIIYFWWYMYISL